MLQNYKFSAIIGLDVMCEVMNLSVLTPVIHRERTILICRILYNFLCFTFYLHFLVVISFVSYHIMSIHVFPTGCFDIRTV